MESYWKNKSPDPDDISVKSEVEFDAKIEPEYAIIIENQIIPDNVTVSELETDVQVKSETEDIEVKMELETDLENEFDVGTKCDSIMVRIFKETMQFYLILVGPFLFSHGSHSCNFSDFRYHSDSL